MINKLKVQQNDADIIVMAGDDDFGERDDDAVGYSAWTGND